MKGYEAIRLAWFLILLNAPLYAQWSTDPTVNNPICTATGRQYLPQIVPDGSGGALIAWVDSRPGYQNDDIYAQRISAAGILQWNSDGVPICTAAGEQYYPEIVGDGSGGAIIVWEHRRKSMPMETAK